MLTLLTADQIALNWEDYKGKVKEYFPSRSDDLFNMIHAMEEAFVFSPASAFEHFHNAIPGGYVDHILRVDSFATKLYNFYKESEMYLDNFSMEELHFSAFHHDLGKVGLPGNPHYIKNDSDWHVKNQGRIYKKNDDLGYMNFTDRTFYLLNLYSVYYSINEMITIKLTDGLYEKANEDYLNTFDLQNKLRISLPYIMHQADMIASRYEFERWAKHTGKFRLDQSTPKMASKNNNGNNSIKDDALSIFDNIF